MGGPGGTGIGGTVRPIRNPITTNKTTTTLIKIIVNIEKFLSAFFGIIDYLLIDKITLSFY